MVDGKKLIIPREKRTWYNTFMMAYLVQCDYRADPGKWELLLERTKEAVDAVAEEHGDKVVIDYEKEMRIRKERGEDVDIMIKLRKRFNYSDVKKIRQWLKDQGYIEHEKASRKWFVRTTPEGVKYLSTLMRAAGEIE